MARITWLDTSRGLAILLLIFVHYLGALTARDFISNEISEYIFVVLRVATPYFILIFGFTSAVIYSKKITDLHSLFRSYKRLAKPLFLILLSRELIVLISSLRFEEIENNLLNILLYQDFSKTGEILTFYFFGVLIAPLCIFLMNKVGAFFLLIIMVTYTAGYAIGNYYYDDIHNMVFRFLFYDVYAFFPFMALAMLAMYFYKLFSIETTNRSKILYFSSMGVVMIFASVLLLCNMDGNKISMLANAELKKPPHITYMLLYTGIALVLTTFLAYLIFTKKMPARLDSFLSLLGRNSLLCYVCHYFLFLASPLTILLFDKKTSIKELVMFLILFLIMISIVSIRDMYKNKKI